MRKDVTEYLSTKDKLVVLIDNLDKGWESNGVSGNDLLMIRTLIEVGRKIERNLSKANIDSFCLVFLRNDIYELLLDNTPDRGKEGKIAIDWTDRNLLKQIIKNRLSSSNVENANWGKIAASHVDDRGSLDWIIDRCLMRPRYLIDFINRCLGSASSRSHSQIEPDDFKSGYQAFSLDALVNTNLEIRDVKPEYYDAVFCMRGMKHRTSRISISLSLLSRGFIEKEHSDIIEIMIWYGVLGVVDDNGLATFIYEVEYNSHVIDQLRGKRNLDDEIFEIIERSGLR